MRPIDADAIKLQKGFFEEVDNVQKFYEWLNKLPTVAPQPGKWIKMSDADGVYFACGMCGESLSRFPHYDTQFDLFPKLKSIEKTNYCPHCGVRMEVAR